MDRNARRLLKQKGSAALEAIVAGQCTERVTGFATGPEGDWVLVVAVMPKAIWSAMSAERDSSANFEAALNAEKLRLSDAIGGHHG